MFHPRLRKFHNGKDYTTLEALKFTSARLPARPARVRFGPKAADQRCPGIAGYIRTRLAKKLKL
jgi:hypothetical protein